MTLRGTVCSTSYVSAIQIQHINQLKCAMFGFDDNKQTTDTLHARTVRNKRTFIPMALKIKLWKLREFHVAICYSNCLQMTTVASAMRLRNFVGCNSSNRIVGGTKLIEISCECGDGRNYSQRKCVACARRFL